MAALSGGQPGVGAGRQPVFRQFIGERADPLHFQGELGGPKVSEFCHGHFELSRGGAVVDRPIPEPSRHSLEGRFWFFFVELGDFDWTGRFGDHHYFWFHPVAGQDFG